MKSTLFNMVAVLFTITLIASAGVGAVNMITEAPIAAAKALATTEAVAKVLPKFANSEISEQNIDGMSIKVYTATSDAGIVGYAVETITKEGFGGMIRMMVGFLPDGKIYNVNILEQTETPGLGTKMCDDGNALLLSVKDKDADEMKFVVKKDGGELDALTAATISSRAYYDAVARAHKAFLVASGAEVETDGVTNDTVATENNEGEEAQEGGKDE